MAAAFRRDESEERRREKKGGKMKKGAMTTLITDSLVPAEFVQTKASRNPNCRRPS